MQARNSARSQHSATEREGERENGVLPLDHLQRSAQVVQNGHEKHCKRNAILFSHVIELKGLRHSTAAQSGIARGTTLSARRFSFRSAAIAASRMDRRE